MTLGDNFPNLPVPMNSRRVCLGFRDMDEKVNLHKICYVNNADKESLESIADRFVLSTKLLAGLTLGQLKEAFNGSNLRIYYEVEEE